MSFSHPQALYLLLLVAMFIGIAIYNFKKKNMLLAAFISATAYKRLGVRSGREIDFFKAGLITLALVFFILALAGPQWGEQFQNVDIRGIEMVFLLDTSNSMNAEDLKPNRLETAKQLIANVVDNLKTDYIGLIAFAGVSFVQCPLTTDYEAFKMLTETAKISPDEEQGTDFQQALQLGIKTLEKSQSDKRLLILITDGEDQEKKWSETLNDLKDKKIIVFTVGIGIPAGAPIPIKDAQGNVTGWKKDKQGNIVKTTLDENTLIQIASRTGGQYFRLTSRAAVDTFVNNLKNFHRSVLAERVKLEKIKRFQYPLFIGIILLFIEFLLSEKRLKWTKE